MYVKLDLSIQEVKKVERSYLEQEKIVLLIIKISLLKKKFPSGVNFVIIIRVRIC